MNINELLIKNNNSVLFSYKGFISLINWENRFSDLFLMFFFYDMVEIYTVFSDFSIFINFNKLIIDLFSKVLKTPSLVDNKVLFYLITCPKMSNCAD